MSDSQRIKANVGTMIDQGATEEDIARYVASEGVTTQDLNGGRLSPDDEAAYGSLAANPSTTAKDLKAFASQKGITIRDSDVAAFMKARNNGSRVSKKIIYEGLPKAPRSSIAQKVGATVGTALDGVLPGAARTIRGVTSIAKDAVDGEGFDASASFQQGKDEQDYAQARLDVENPNISTAASAAGLVGGFALPEVRLARGAGILPGMANGALTAGGYGAISGALNETGGGNLENMALGGLAGAGMGAVAPLAFRGAMGAAGSIRRNLPGADPTARFIANLPRRALRRHLEQPGDAAAAQAERRINAQLESGTIATGMGAGTVPATPANVGAEVARRQAMGVPAMPGDVSEASQRVTSRALRGEGVSASRARSALMARQAQQGARVRGHITDELGPAVNPIQAVDEINRRASAEAGPLYQEAYEQPLNITPEMVRISRTPAFQDAMPQAMRNIRNDMRDPRALGFILDDAGEVVRGPVNDISVEGMDQVIRAMRDSGAAAMDTSGFRPRNTTNSVAINARARELRGHLASQNEPYADVTRRYADSMDVREALENGQDIAKLSGHEIDAQMRDMTAGNAREAWMTGARTSLADDAIQAGLRPSTNVAASIRGTLGLSSAGRASAGGDAAKQQAIETMSGRPGVVGRLDDRLEAESQAYETFAQAARSGPPKPQDEQSLQAAAALLGAAGKAATGNWRSLAVDIARGRPQGTMKFQRDFDDRTIGVLTANDPADVSAAMAALERRGARDALRDTRRNRAASKVARMGALSAAAQSTDPVDGEMLGPWAGDPAGVIAPRYKIIGQ